MTTITPSHAYHLSRRLVGLEVNGQADDLPPDLRRIDEHLANLPPEARGSEWATICDTHPAGDALALAVVAIDPTGPAPAPEAEAEAADNGSGQRPYRMTRADAIEPRPVEWLWPDRVPLGMLSLWAGDPGLGKSMASTALAAATSRGAPMPLSKPPDGPGDAVIMSAEDDPARTIIPRLKAAGANLTHVHLFESVILADGAEALPSLRSGMAAIEAAVASVDRPRLVIIDPVSAYLAGTDDHRNAELRGVLSPLKAMAERLDVAVILVTHLTKSNGTNAKHRVVGSIAYVGACRAGFLFVRDRDDPSGRRVLMLANKFNTGPEPPTLAYQIADRGDGPAVEWEAEPVPITAAEALAAEAAESDPAAASEARACDEWLKASLAEAGGRMLAGEIERAGRDAGFSRDQLKRSKSRLGVASDREGFGQGSRCYWRLPQ